MNHIRIILMNTFHAGNIGSTARAMKTMGLSDLWLVNPSNFPSNHALQLAAGAKDLLAKAIIVSSLDEAIAQCTLVIGTSARMRHLQPTMMTPQQCAQKLIQSTTQKSALVFGQETMGLSNEDLLKCHYHVAIPAHPSYPVLNVAAAVQILCYEIYQAKINNKTYPLQSTKSTTEYPSSQALKQFYTQLASALSHINFLRPQHPGMTMTRLQRFFQRARPEKKELNMLQGIISAILNKNK